MGKSSGKGVGNIEINKKDNYLVVSINPRIYPLEVVYSAAYVFIDRAYVMIDGNPEEEIFVQMKPKNKKENLEKIGNEFNNELVNYAVYVVQATRNQPLRKAIIERALMTNVQQEEYQEEQRSGNDQESEEDYIVDDPLGIAKPWKPPKEEEK